MIDKGLKINYFWCGVSVLTIKEIFFRFEFLEKNYILAVVSWKKDF